VSFRKTGIKLEVTREESLCYCDWCDKQISIDAYRLKPHYDLNWNPEDSYDDGSMSDSWDLCSVECVAAWSAAGGKRGGKWNRLPPGSEVLK